MKDIEIFAGERAATYDSGIKLWCPDYDFSQALVPVLLSAYLPVIDKKKILVAGCGTGTEMKNIILHAPQWHVTGVDPSPEMVALAREKLANIPPGSYQLITGTTHDLLLSPTYDAATLLLVLHFLTDDGAKLALLQSLASRLKRGALLLILDIFGEEFIFEQQLKLLQAYLQQQGIAPATIEQGIAHITTAINYVSENRLLELLHEAGFGKAIRIKQTFVFGGWITEKQS